MLTSAGPADGSWDLNIYVTDIKVSKTVRTRGDVHIGGLMVKLVSSIDEPAKDWSDHAMWWPENNMWLSRTRRTLDQYGVQAGTTLHFTPMHKMMRVVLPDLQNRDMRLNFAANVFNNVISICKSLSIRHPEELSLARTTDRKSQRQSVHQPPSSSKAATSSTNNGELRGPDTASADILLGRSMDNLFDANDSTAGCKTASLDSLVSVSSLTCSPCVSTAEAGQFLSRPQSYADKAKMNNRWFDSSLSLMEQDVQENDRIMLRYKFSAFFDLNAKYDAVRINQIYEQARWSVICDHVKCSDEEMIFLAGLELHIRQQQSDPQSSVLTTMYDDDVDGRRSATDPVDHDDVGAALDSLQMSLDDTDEAKPAAANLTTCSELRGYHLFLKPKKFSLKSYKRLYFVLSDSLKVFCNEKEQNQVPLLTINLRGCDVQGEATVGERKFIIKLTILSDDPPTEYWLRQDNPDQYAEWLAAIRLAARRKTLANSTYNNEVQSVLELLRYRQPTASSTSTTSNREVNARDVNPDELVSASLVRRLGRRKVIKRILEARSRVQDKTAVDAKLTFIKAWQSLPDSGSAYFIITYKGSKKKDLIGISVQRLAQLDMTTGHCLKAWTYDMMTSWSVNWKTEHVKIELGDSNEVTFQCLSASCKTVHEYIGGYVFLAMRSLDKNQTLNEELFQKLTGGRV
jgi:kindlin 2